MIYEKPADGAGFDQGDLIDGCPTVRLANFVIDDLNSVETVAQFHRVVILTQTCDVANRKAKLINIAVIYDASDSVARGDYKATAIRGAVRDNRMYGVYFLPACPELGLPEMIADLRNIHSHPVSHIERLVQAGKRRGRLQELYRLHMNRHLGDGFSRIGVPGRLPSDD